MGNGVNRTNRYHGSLLDPASLVYNHVVKISGFVQKLTPPATPLAAAGVCAVVVTFNRKNLLRECLNSVLVQSRVPDHIVVIDNNSTDGTFEMLKAEFECLPTGPGMTIIRQKENMGGAGGFAAGFDWAHRNGFEWLWVMDDDVEMLPGALEMLLSYQDVSDFIQCRRKNPGSDVKLDSLWDISCGVASQPSSTILHQELEDDTRRHRRTWISVQWGNFEGALVHRSVVDRIGLPDARFFVAGDDSTYGLEASFHTNVIYVKEYGVQRKLDPPKRSTKLAYYLTLRNRFLIRGHLKKLGFDVNPIVFWTSQLVSLAWVTKSVLRDGGQPHKFEMLGTVLRGLLDGATGRFGRPPFLKA